MDQPPMFNSVEDECRYWKEKAKFFHKEWSDVKQEYDEHVEQSQQLEAEMDATLDQKESVIKDLRAKLSSLEKENEYFKIKIESHNTEYSTAEKQLEIVKKERDEMREYLRQLEQKNDDLERAHRILNESIVDFEKMLDKAYEKNALLEMEMDEKEVLQEKLQRLMDETRDLKQELNVKSRYPTAATNGPTVNNCSSPDRNVANGVLLSNGDISSAHHDMTTRSSVTTASSMMCPNNVINMSAPTIGDYGTQHSLKRKTSTDPENILNGNAMTASSRTSALNIVSDILRKLNLDKALLCPQCQKFRCICDRTSSISNASSSTTSLAGNFDRQIITNPVNNNSDNAINSRITSSSSSNSLNFGTNIFKRFAEHINGNAPTTTPPSNMEPQT